MPKERVKRGDLWVKNLIEGSFHKSEPGEDIAEDAIRNEDPSLDVTWMREAGHVQVSIEFSRETWIELAKDLEEHPEITKRAIYTGSLSRHEINHMIRTLRRARDHAYGADE